MSKINLDNYEAFLLDYFEGSLSAGEVAELLIFSEAHPELNIDLEAHPDVELSVEPTNYNEKASLKALSLTGPVSHDNIDTFLIADLEGELDFENKSALELFLSENVAYKKDAAIYQKTRLVPVPCAFPNKERLKHVPVITLQPIRTGLAIAASILLLIYVGFEQLKPTFTPASMDYSYYGATNMNEATVTHHRYMRYPNFTIEGENEMLVQKGNTENLQLVQLELRAMQPIQYEEEVEEIEYSVSINDLPIPTIIEEVNDENNKTERAQTEKVITPYEFIAQRIKKRNGIAIEDSAASREQRSFFQTLTADISALIGGEFNIERNKDGEVQAYEVRIGNTAISRKKYRN